MIAKVQVSCAFLLFFDNLIDKKILFGYTIDTSDEKELLNSDHLREEGTW